VQEETLCGAVASRGQRCGGDAGVQACDEKLGAVCGSLGSLLNPALLEAARQCALAAACSAAPTSCFTSAVAKAEARDSHRALAEAYCVRCAATPGSDCEQSFLSAGGSSKTAALVLPLSDALASELVTKCAGAPGCGSTFIGCAESVITKEATEQLDSSGGTCLMQELFEGVASSGNDGVPPPSTCKAATCTELGKSCGLQDDGCGKKIDCGACPTNCSPKTCAQLGKSCGTWDDGCGTTASCGTCPTPCPADAKEPNDDRSRATDLGPLADSPVTPVSIPSLSLPDGDEDWFTAKVADAGWFGNPRIQVSAGHAMEVTIYYVCNAGGDDSSCAAGTTPDDAIGHGCRGTGASSLSTSCSTWDESGTAYIRVRKTTSDNLCGAYTLDVRVDEG
jgi:hypothetical protein